MKFEDLEIGQWFSPGRLKLSFDIYYNPKTGEVKESVNPDMPVEPVTVTVREASSTGDFQDILPGSHIIYGDALYLRTRSGMLKMSGEGPLLVSPEPTTKLTVLPRVEVIVHED